MTTAKKTTAKKVAEKAPVKAPAKKTPAKAIKRPVKLLEPEAQTFGMPREVKEWIERANSTMAYLRNQVATLKEENAKLKSYQKFAEKRILGTSHE